MATPEDIAGLPEDALEILQSTIENESDAAAFTAGYKLALDSSNRLRFSGLADTRFAAILEAPEIGDEWLDSHVLEWHGGSVMIQDSAFLLGAVTAALVRKKDRGLSRPSELAATEVSSDF